MGFNDWLTNAASNYAADLKYTVQVMEEKKVGKILNHVHWKFANAMRQIYLNLKNNNKIISSLKTDGSTDVPTLKQNA